MIKTAQIKLLRGFTLIELLIVIAILGILAAAVLVAVNPTKRSNQAKDSTVQTDIASIGGALQAYYTSSTKASYPVALNDLVTNEDLKAVPKDPGGVDYTYRTYPTALACADTIANPCVDAAVWRLMHDQPAGGTAVWCFETKTGKAQKITVAANCDNDVATI